MANDIAIKVNNVSKIYNLYETNTDRALGMLGFRHGIKYREHHALKDVSFEVKKGDCVGIIGTNGAGKSTMLKIITGVLSPKYISEWNYDRLFQGGNRCKTG